MARDIIFRCMSVPVVDIVDNKGTYDLMKHKRLTVDLDGYPLYISIERRITNIDGDHEPLDGTISKWFPDCIVVEITSRQPLCSRDIPLHKRGTYWVPTNSLIKALNRSSVD
jgi:hypothetical protein